MLTHIRWCTFSHVWVSYTHIDFVRIFLVFPVIIKMMGAWSLYDYILIIKMMRAWGLSSNFLNELLRSVFKYRYAQELDVPSASSCLTMLCTFAPRARHSHLVHKYWLIRLIDLPPEIYCLVIQCGWYHWEGVSISHSDIGPAFQSIQNRLHEKSN